ncbi:hypothetical protein F5887DRAFT_1172004 [Amanita rubescens]|nr:hypothetical protein F5887DRAFT_1172004 [Amanita rubescens]
MSSHPSSSNGHSKLTNGASPSDAGHSDSFDNLSPSGSSSGYPVNGYSHIPFPSHHNEEIVNHLYHSGFQTGNYADTILHVHQNAYRLHAIILSRSPYLAHLMSTSPQTSGQRVIHVRLDDEPEVSQEGFAIALGYLYSVVSLSLIRPDNARAVLAAGCLLGGMDDLCQFAIGEWLNFAESIPPTADGTATPDAVNLIVVMLPDTLEIHKPPHEQTGQTGRDLLLQIYARAPFELFKAAVESPTFQIGSDQARFKFAKEAIELRKQGIARGSGAEETVVLAFGGGNFGGSAVHITRKLRKRPLWKVGS